MIKVQMKSGILWKAKKSYATTNSLTLFFFLYFCFGPISLVLRTSSQGKEEQITKSSAGQDLTTAGRHCFCTTCLAWMEHEMPPLPGDDPTSPTPPPPSSHLRASLANLIALSRPQGLNFSKPFNHAGPITRPTRLTVQTSLPYRSMDHTIFSFLFFSFFQNNLD